MPLFLLVVAMEKEALVIGIATVVINVCVLVVNLLTAKATKLSAETATAPDARWRWMPCPTVMTTLFALSAEVERALISEFGRPEGLTSSHSSTARRTKATAPPLFAIGYHLGMARSAHERGASWR